jgi:hypothetical protein
MSNLLFTAVSVEQQEIVAGGYGVKVITNGKQKATNVIFNEQYNSSFAVFENNQILGSFDKNKAILG